MAGRRMLATVEPGAAAERLPSMVGASRPGSHLGPAWFARTESGNLPVLRRDTLPVFRQAEGLLAQPRPTVSHRPTRIPTHAIVALAPPAGGPLALPAPAAAPVAGSHEGGGGGANDNHVPSRRRRVVKEALFLVIYALTLAGIYFVGRQHGLENVIVVPDTRSRTVTIT